LFYHKRTHYTFGPSPLVVWLKAFMLPEILGISVPSDLLARAPGTYTGFSAHAKTVRQKKLDREQKMADHVVKSRGCHDNGQVCHDDVSPCDVMSAGDGVNLTDSSQMATNSAADGVTDETDHVTKRA